MDQEHIGWKSWKLIARTISPTSSLFVAQRQTKLIKNYGENEAWAYTGTAQIYTVPPIISGTGKAMNFKFCRNIHRLNPSKSPLKLWRQGAWAYPRSVQIFWVPPIISETGKAKNVKFCTHIHRIDRYKSPLNISGKLTLDVLRDSRKFSGHPYIGRIARSSLR